MQNIIQRTPFDQVVADRIVNTIITNIIRTATRRLGSAIALICLTGPRKKPVPQIAHSVPNVYKIAKPFRFPRKIFIEPPIDKSIPIPVHTPNPIILSLNPIEGQRLEFSPPATSVIGLRSLSPLDPPPKADFNLSISVRQSKSDSKMG